MTVNKQLRDGTQPDVPEQASQPVPTTGDLDGAGLPSNSAQAPPSAPSATAEAPAAGNVAATLVELRCAECGAGRHGSEGSRCAEGHTMCWKCGAGAHATVPDICTGGHALHGNRRTLTHGLYAAQPVDAAARADAVAAAGDPWWRYDWQREMFVEVGARLSDLLESMRGRTRALSVPNMKLGMGLLREMNQVGGDIEAAQPSRPRVSDSDHLERVARVARRHPDAFVAMFTEALAVDGQLAPLLRAALDAHDAKPQPEREPADTVPVPDGKPLPVDDEQPDEIIL